MLDADDINAIKYADAAELSGPLTAQDMAFERLANRLIRNSNKRRVIHDGYTREYDKKKKVRRKKQ